jgi:hypothetical protein
MEMSEVFDFVEMDLFDGNEYEVCLPNGENSMYSYVQETNELGIHWGQCYERVTYVPMPENCLSDDGLFVIDALVLQELTSQSICAAIDMLNAAWRRFAHPVSDLLSSRERDVLFDQDEGCIVRMIDNESEAV